MNIMNKNEKILIVGLGLIGGSYAKILFKKGYLVYGLSNKQEDIDYAIHHHMIIDGQINVTKEFIGQFKYIIFALYPSIFINWIKQYGSYISLNTIISDVSGIKGNLVQTIQENLPKSIEFIGAHPMAGKEVYGIKNADENLFKGANYIITPNENNSQKGIDFATQIGELIEASHISVLSPSKHDEMIAFLSQLTHCIAITLMTCKKSEHLKAYCGDSFRDLTRIANINENMWCELFLNNKEELLSQMDLFLNEMNLLRQYIQNNNEVKIKEMMKISTQRRKHFNKEK